MKVKIVGITQSMVEGINTAEELLVYIARVSNPSNQMNTTTSDKLIRYLIDHKHWSPFDQINLNIEVVTSKAVAVQILRHWSIKPQEFSQRYAEVVDIEPIELRKQGKTNRQVGDEVFDPLVTTSGDLAQWKASELVADVVNYCKESYKKLIKAGVAKECARMILPMAASTTLYLNGSIRSWIHYLEQRTSEHAQKEHRDVANQIQEVFKEYFPMTAKALGI